MLDRVIQTGFNAIPFRDPTPFRTVYDFHIPTSYE